MKTRILSLIFCLFVGKVQAQQDLFPHQKQAWVDSVLKQMSLDEKIGQVLMPRGNANPQYDTARLFSIVRNYKVGGFVFFAGYPNAQARLLNQLQALSKVPLMIGMDLEWGLNMRLDSTIRYPYQMTLGAMQGNEGLIEQMGYQIAQQCRRIGVHINYAPVVDINNNPLNPVINFRSFGEDREAVTKKALAYMRGLQKGGVLTSAKHFPGHGDTGVDSHYDIPVLPHDKKRLDSLELYPYRQLIQQGLQGVMVGHLSLPVLDTTKNLASTLSKPIVQGLLREELGFKGLIFTDAMDMKGATKMFPEGGANVRALLAGNDVLETFLDVPAAFNAIKAAIENGALPLAALEDRVRRILNAKAWLGLDQYRPIELKDLLKDLQPLEGQLLNKSLAEKTITLLKNPADLVPLRRLDTLKIASLAIGKANYGPSFPNAFQLTAAKYTQVDAFYLDENSTEEDIQKVEKALANYQLHLISIQGLSIRPANNYNLKAPIPRLLQRMVSPKAIVVHLANPMTLTKFDGLERAAALLSTLQEGIPQMEVAAEVIFGGLGAQGKFPVSLNAQYTQGMGIQSPSLGRLRYQILPEALGIDGAYLEKNIDSLANLAIQSKATPGAVILVAKAGKVIFHKAYGKQRYEATEPLSPDALFDLASITKISTSVPALMKWQDEGKFDVRNSMGAFIPSLQQSNKAHLNYLDVLSHQAKLKAWIPFWMDFIDSTAMIANSKKFQERYASKDLKYRFLDRFMNKQHAEKLVEKSGEPLAELWKTCVDLKTEVNRWKPNTLSYIASEDYPTEVAPGLYAHRSMGQQVWKAIQDSPLREKKEYVYSDLSYYLLPPISKEKSGKEWTEFLADTFYKPLGATTLVYQADRHFPLERIVPTEYDSLFRKTLIHGKVHDEGAALLNGISGHAGLFGNANDLAKLMQMYLQKGYFGGQQFIQANTLAAWTSYPFSIEENARRGIGFDKPDRKRPNISAAPSASPESFGHSGFTGTYTWVDPAHDLVYVFLSNRVYPTRNNSKLSDLNIRTGIQEVLYQAIKRGR